MKVCDECREAIAKELESGAVTSMSAPVHGDDTKAAMKFVAHVLYSAAKYVREKAER